ncbi:MAG: patatin-like phospholipase family protein [Planctomycetes bacterium]|nr:patatin-like phospholipase family protein [Planctomycetota bacterium]
MKEPSDAVARAADLRRDARGLPTSELAARLFDERDGSGEHLVEQLRNAGEFELARELLGRLDARDDLSPERTATVRQQVALCIYKDPDLPAKGRLDSAWAELTGGDAELQGCEDPETLGIAGAIARRYWHLDGHRSHLERALAFYERGHGAVKAGKGRDPFDAGFPGINAAFLLDQLAALHEAAHGGPSAGGLPDVAALQRASAAALRREILAMMTPLAADGGPRTSDWWYVATLAEAHFGLADFEAATAAFEGHCEGVPEWQVRTTFEQLIALARLHGHFDPARGEFVNAEARRCLATTFASCGRSGDVETVALASQKIGLALSGGGFRASFYELGVLAALAEFDLLRHVEVISTVSGGSILGAHYYLELQHLLQGNGHDGIGRSDYIDVVKRVIDAFGSGVERNIRTRVVAHPWHTARMLFTSRYSRTKRAGELYEEHLYRRATGVKPGPILMRDLLIHPPDEAEDFKPRSSNWRRSAKVPILVLNATSLNTGHNWQFTATWMGEPPVEPGIDASPRLRRMYYRDLVGTSGAEHADTRLGHAVAASACVPGLFEPLALGRLYEDTGAPQPAPTTVRLVDGGVHDNQGIATLLEQDCSVLLVADGSGQIGYLPDPGSALVGGLTRTNSAIMARVREAQLRDLGTQREVGRRQGLSIVHLKQDLFGRPVNWLGCKQPKDGSEDPATRSIGAPRTAFGIRKSAAERIAAIRTDLDSFSQLERFALMYSGYRAARRAIRASVATHPLHLARDRSWPFLAVRAALIGRRAESKSERLIERHLRVGAQGAFRAWQLVGWLRPIGWALLLGGGGALLWWTYDSQRALLTLGAVWWMAVAALATAVFGAVAKKVWPFLRPGELVSTYLTRAALIVAGFLVSWVHLLTFDRLFLSTGRAARLGRERPTR